MRKTLRVIMWTAVVLAVIIGGLRATILNWWTIPDDDPVMSASIAPSVWGGDFVLLYRGGKPKFGDLVRCTDPDEPRRFVIGRIVGEPGDKVTIEGNDVIVNNRRSTTEMVCTNKKVTIANPTSGGPEELLCTIEENGGHKHKRLMRSSGSTLTRTATVGDGNVFLVSDNRAFPFDSRDYGAVPRSSCTDQIFFRVFGKSGVADEEGRFVYVQ